jgi:phytoene dehydrogenase-like protein
MPDLATIPNQPGQERRRSGAHWHMPPAIERASASREPKKSQQPVAAKPAPVEVATIASLPPGTVFRLVTDLEGMKEAFRDRIEDLNVALTEVDFASGMTRGNMQKLLSESDAKWAREFGWKTLGKALDGTGMVLAFIIDDERFASTKAQMVKRKLKRA